MYFVTESGDVPDFVATRERVLTLVIWFIRTLRRNGVEVPANAGIVAVQALIEVGFADRDRAQAAVRSALVSRPEDIETFDRFFLGFWQQLMGGPPEDNASADDRGGLPDDLVVPDESSITETDDESPADETGVTQDVGRETVEVQVEARDEQDSEDIDETSSGAAYSPSGRSERIVPDSLTAIGHTYEIARPVNELTKALAGLRGRRWTRVGDEQIDARRSLRESFGTGGTIFTVPTRGRKPTIVRAVLLVDVSRSVLDIIDRAFLIQFLGQVRNEWRDTRIFFFDTSVRDVTEAFDEPTPTAALDALERAEAEWGGGTRIGHAIETLRQEHQHVVDRDTIVFIISDGLEVGEINLLENGMSWVSKRAKSVLWLNPLAASTEYEPSCRGMAASVPYLDGLFAFSTPADISEIARQIRQHGLYGAIGYQHDPRRINLDTPVKNTG